MSSEWPSSGAQRLPGLISVLCGIPAVMSCVLLTFSFGEVPLLSPICFDLLTVAVNCLVCSFM